jgi:FAD dependent oxidoreductase TIGR03364
MIWPVGQPPGLAYETALRSRARWLEVLEDARLPYWPDGSLHVAYRDDEADVAQEFAEIAPGLGYKCAWLNAGQVRARSKAVQSKGLMGGLWSETELTVDPRVTLAKLPLYLKDKLGVEFRFGCCVHSIDAPQLDAGGQRWLADQIIVCSGDDFESLYPQIYAQSGLTRVKLQMLRTEPQPGGWRLGPALAAGLTLRFYPAFGICGALRKLKERIAAETPEYDRWGIHGLVSQTEQGELTLGDSHEYGLCVDIFNKEEIDALILRYISGFLNAPSLRVTQRWHGVYAKHPEKPYLSLVAAPGVRIVTAPGGSGMTLSFGIAAQTMVEMGL